jgi:hypothetical protein
MNDGIARTDTSAIRYRGVYQHNPAHLHDAKDRNDQQKGDHCKFHEALAAFLSEANDTRMFDQFSNLITVRL